MLERRLPLPSTAQVASEQAEYLMQVLPCHLEGKPLTPFAFTNKESLLSLGAGGFVAEFKESFSDDILISEQCDARSLEARKHGEGRGILYAAPGSDSLHR